MRFYNSLFLTSLTCLLAARASAQTPLTWEQVKQQFISANPTLMAGQINIDESKAQEVTAYLRPNPDFTIAADLRSKLGGFYTIVMVDADHLKRVNDSFGHAAGSDLIRTVADAIRSAARSGDDLCSRIGGDEFIVRLASASDAGALAYCRRVRTYLGEHPLLVDAATVLPISVSIGVAAFPKHGRSLSEVTHRADQALYRSKQEGR